MTIGERIKALRKANHITQEKLAESLCVSCQAVSKWECGISLPDILLVAPIAKFFHITADELLGIYDNDAKEKKQKYDAAFRKFRYGQDYNGSYWWAREATIEFPEDFTYLEWLAYAEYQLAFSELQENSPSGEYFEEMTECSLRHFEKIITDCFDTELYTKAVMGKILILRLTERIVEAEWSAEFEYPDAKIKTATQALSLCEEGQTLLNYLENERSQFTAS